MSDKIAAPEQQSDLAPASAVASGPVEPMAALDRLLEEDGARRQAHFDEMKAQAEARRAGPVVLKPSTPPVVLQQTPEEPVVTPDPSGTTVPKQADPLGPPADVFQAPVASAEPAEPAASAAPAEPEPPEVKSDKKAANAWTNIKRENKALKDELAVAKAEQDTLKQRLESVVSVEEVAKLKTQLEDYENRLGQLDVTQSKAFQERYDIPLQTLFLKGVAMLQRGGRDQAAAQKIMTEILQAGGAADKVAELLSDDPGPVQAAVFQQVVDIGDLVKKRTEAVADWKGTKSMLKDSDGRRMTADLAKQVVQDTDDAAHQLVAERSWIFNESATNADWNVARDGYVRAARRILTEGNSKELAKYVLEGVAASYYRKWGEVEHQRANQLEAELKARVRTRPGLGARSEIEPPPSNDVPEDAPERKPALNINDWLNSAMKDLPKVV